MGNRMEQSLQKLMSKEVSSLEGAQCPNIPKSSLEEALTWKVKGSEAELKFSSGRP